MRNGFAVTQTEINPSGDSHSAAHADSICQCNQALSELYATRGRLHFFQGDLQLAVADLTQAIQLGPQNALAHFCRGLAHEALDDFERAKADHAAALKLDTQVKMQNAAYGRLESGFRVIALYNSGREDHRPLGFYPFSLTGLRQAITHAQKLGRSESDRSELDNRYQVDADDIIAVVQEYHLIARDVDAVPPQSELFGSLAGPSFYSRQDRLHWVMPVPGHGYWPFWDRVFNGPTTVHDLTEADAFRFSRSIETAVRENIIANNFACLDSAFRQLSDPGAVVKAALLLLHEEGPRFSAEQLLRYMDQGSGNRLSLLDHFVGEMDRACCLVMTNVLSTKQDLIERLPVVARDRFSHDLDNFIGEEVIKRLAERTVPADTVAAT